MFTKSTAFYDAIYAAAGKDYSREARQIHALIQQHKRSRGNAFLDVACGTWAGIEHFTEDHTLGLFSHDDYAGAFRAAGLDVIHDSEGLMGRGLYIGVRPHT